MFSCSGLKYYHCDGTTLSTFIFLPIDLTLAQWRSILISKQGGLSTSPPKSSKRFVGRHHQRPAKLKVTLKEVCPMLINLLFAVDDKFVDRMLVTLYSIRQNSPTDNQYAVYVLQDQPFNNAATLKQKLQRLDMTYHPVIVDDKLFANAPLSDRYPRSIYYRLLASDLLLTDLDKVLYLDADILAINDLTPLYQTDLTDSLYAAAMHTDFLNLTGTFNQFRLDTATPHYFNSGVLLINLKRARQVVDADKIFAVIREHHDELLLPDQDVLNKLYADDTQPVPDVIYNYDVRKNLTYQATSQGKWDLDWVIRHTVFLHYCGTKKPWLPNATDRFAFLYKHYQHQSKRL